MIDTDTRWAEMSNVFPVLYKTDGLFIDENVCGKITTGFSHITEHICSS